MTDGMSGMDGTKARVQEGSTEKNHSCQLAKLSGHISSFYWARIQINILLLTKLVGLMYAVVLSSGWSHITSPAVRASTETLDVMVWRGGSRLGVCVGPQTVALHTFSHLTQVCSWRIKGLFMPLCLRQALCFWVVTLSWMQYQEHLKEFLQIWHTWPFGLDNELI